ncbi:hypothetical protein COA08_01370 [Bacillus cereus]|uniref:DUF6440 domain-containing protein n=1 Tax=Bacillus cereus TaxID=1396 RepID=A0A2C0F0K4_BACCE|nr:DUF6440 family protein [Bacillus cereus]PGQ11976.1 hypothetical protein COA08_01370 [Bacillus cereus]
MKKKLIFLSVILLAACSSESNVSAENQKSMRFKEIEFHQTDRNNITIIQDTKTGCKYMQTRRISSDSSTMTPLYKGDKQIDCD